MRGLLVVFYDASLHKMYIYDCPRKSRLDKQPYAYRTFFSERSVDHEIPGSEIISGWRAYNEQLYFAPQVVLWCTSRSGSWAELVRSPYFRR